MGRKKIDFLAYCRKLNISCKISCSIPIREVLEDISPTDFHVKDLEWVSFLNEGETLVTGMVIRERAGELNAKFGLSDVKRFLDGQIDIPTEFKGKKYIILAGTVLWSPSDGPCFPCLCWGRGELCLFPYWWSGRDFNVDGLLPRRK